MFIVKIFLISLIIFKKVNLEKFEGDVCTTDNFKGKCTNIGKCPEAVGELKNRKLPELCGFNGSVPIVCCKILSKTEEYCNVLLRLQKNIPPTIVGGKDALLGDFPHMVALGYGTKNNIDWKCGGSLISDRFVLTAAHCLTNGETDVKYARLGVTTLNNSFTEDDFEIARIIKHPDYKPPIVYNDIALLELNRSAIFNSYLLPVCLFHKPTSESLDLLATGWGLTHFAGDRSVVLQQVTLQSFNNTLCSSIYKSVSKRRLPNGISEDKQICAGSHEEKDTCQGDSGGPLQMREYGRYKVVGVTSFGKTCGTPGVPAVYTRISYYIPWIESVVWS